VATIKRENRPSINITPHADAEQAPRKVRLAAERKAVIRQQNAELAKLEANAVEQAEDRKRPVTRLPLAESEPDAPPPPEDDAASDKMNTLRKSPSSMEGQLAKVRANRQRLATAREAAKAIEREASKLLAAAACCLGRRLRQDLAGEDMDHVEPNPATLRRTEEARRLAAKARPPAT
jgi:hypothetical protein